MEGFPEGSKKFLKRSADFQKSSNLEEPSNDNFLNPLKQWEQLGRSRVEIRLKSGEIDKDFILGIRSRIESGEITADYAMGLMTGISEEFLKIYTTAQEMKERLNQHTIREYKNEYSKWSREEVLAFVNNPKNVSELQRRPALVVALGNLLE